GFLAAWRQIISGASVRISLCSSRRCKPDRDALALFKGFHRRRCDTSRKRYAVKEAFANQVASDKGKLAPGVVSFICPLFQRCRHPGAAFGPECPPRRKQLRQDCLGLPLARFQWPQQVLDPPPASN